ncbi:hypothetical protein BDF14DRAFT_1810389 [Spinellus fusiger]|nr:hypothetical protein BDF14DRAFT_1810389 [Spinellus fusiger]
MADKPTRTPVTSTRQRSILGDLGIKPNGTQAPAAKPSSAKPSSTKPPAKLTTTTTAKAADTLLKRANTVGGVATGKAPTSRPRPLSSIHRSPSTSTQLVSPGVQRSTSSLSRTSNSSSGSASSKLGKKTSTAVLSINTPSSRPVTKPPTTAPLTRRRSVVPAGPTTPTARRSSVAAGVPLSNVSKRMSTPSFDSFVEMKSIKDTLAQREELLEEKEKQLSDLRMRIELLEKERSERPDQNNPLLSSSSYLIPCDVSVDSKSNGSDTQQGKVIMSVQSLDSKKHTEDMTALQTQLSTLLNENKSLKTALEEEKIHKEKKDIEEKEATKKQRKDSERVHQEALEILKDEHKRTLEKITKDYEQQYTTLRETHEQKEHEWTQTLQTSEEVYKVETEKLQEAINTLRITMDESKSLGHLRKLEKQLSDQQATFEDYKRQTEQAKDTLERRFRDEMQQLQNGSDDTAQVWVEKNRAAQQEIDRLHKSIHELTLSHVSNIVEREAVHAKQLEGLELKRTAQETEMEGQAHQIESLLFQVETLQTALEAATARLEEHTVRLHSKDSTENINGRTSGHSEDVHKLCKERLDTRQHDIDELHSRITGLKAMHEAQLNRLSHEKAKELEQLQQKLGMLEQKHQAQIPLMEERLQSIAQQHTKEINVMHEQYQKLVDIKDQALEDYAYRVRALSASRQKEIDQLREETNEKTARFEYEIEGYESRIKELEQHTQEINQSLHQWENQGNADKSIIDKLKHDCSAHRDENDQLISLLSQLQGELHKGRA